MTELSTIVDDVTEAWNAHDRDTLSATVTRFVATDNDTADGETGGEVDAFLTAFPDVRYYRRNVASGPDTVFVAWQATATHAGDYHGCPPTQRRIRLRGVDEYTRDADGDVCVVRTVDRSALLDRSAVPGRQVVGTGTTASAGPGAPEPGISSRIGAARIESAGALLLTRLTVRDADESALVDELSVEITKALRASRGFLGTLTADVGEEKFTVSAFAGPEAMRAVHTRSHQRAVRRFFSGGMSTRAVISAWSPTSIREYARCAECGEVRQLTDAASCQCACGHALTLSPLI